MQQPLATCVPTATWNRCGAARADARIGSAPLALNGCEAEDARPAAVLARRAHLDADQYVKISVNQILRVSGLAAMASAPEKSAYSNFPIK